MKELRPLVAALAVLGGGLVLGGCGGAKPAPVSAADPALTVTLKNLAYNPAQLSVKAGDTVTFVWKDGSIPHNVDGDSDLASFTSGTAKTGGSWTFTFHQAGTYSYHCDIHPNMQGIINVS